MVDAVVEYDYEAKEEDELNITKGDIITNIHKLDGGWWEGTLNGKTGVFPDNFVKEIEKEKKKSKDLSSSIKRGSASGGAGGGHVAELANKLGKEGLKVGGAGPPKRDSKPPGNSVESPPILAAGAATGPLPHRVRVAHSYTPKNDDELELIVGQIVNVTNKEEEGWWEGTLNDGRAGVFPSNFVEELKEEAPEENADEFHAIQGKKIKGIGFGNIFAGGPVKLKGAKKQESGDSTTEPPKPPPQEAKRKSQAPPVPSSEPQNAAPKEKQGERARVLFAYTAENEDELTIEEGQIVYVLEKELVDSGWWKGELNGRKGVFPDNFVELLPVEEAPKPKRPNAPPAAVASAKPAKASVHHKPAPAHSPAKQRNHAEPKALNKTAGGSATALTTTMGPTPSRKPTMPPPLSKKPDKDLDAVETTERLSHPTANRAKAPVRRPPSQAPPGKENNVVPHEMEPPVRHSRPPAPVLNSEPASIKENGGAGELGAVAAASNVEAESLRQELAELRANSVSKTAHEQLHTDFITLKESLEKWQSKHTKLLTDLMEEVDEEKKLRLSAEVEMKRIKKMVQP